MPWYCVGIRCALVRRDYSRHCRWYRGGYRQRFTVPASLTVKTGVYSVSLKDVAAGPHTLAFDDPKTLFAGLAVNAAGETNSSRIFFGEPGEYTYFCAIPGHRAGGMSGTITVTGPPMTLEQAEAAAGGGAAPPPA